MKTAPISSIHFFAGRPSRVLELETMLEQSGGNDAAAFQNEFGFRTHEDCADLQHPCSCREAEPDAARLTKYLHEVCVG